MRPSLDASELTRQRKTRTLQIAHQRALRDTTEGRTVRSAIQSGNEGSNEAAVFTDIRVGALYTPCDCTLPTAPSAPPVLPTVVYVANDANEGAPFFTVQGTLVSDGGAPITACGFCWSTSTEPTIADNVANATAGCGVGPMTVNVNAFPPFTTLYGRLFATNSAGTAYSAPVAFVVGICLAAGTMITLADRTRKTIEDITYNDDILVWDFDNGVFASAKPLWIKIKETATQYNRLEFDDGTILKTINQHRIFNKAASRFTYPMSEETPIGITTFTDAETCPVLLTKTIVEEPVDYYNVVTNYHMNLFANGILTSLRYNNLYVIRDMKFEKWERPVVPISAFDGAVPQEYYDGLRLSENPTDIEMTKAYVARMIAHRA